MICGALRLEETELELYLANSTSKYSDSVVSGISLPGWPLR